MPETNFRTLGAEDVARFHREMSPGDRLGKLVEPESLGICPGRLGGGYKAVCLRLIPASMTYNHVARDHV